MEANLVGQEGHILAEIHRQVNHPAMVLIFDGANIVVQGYSQEEIYEQYLAMKPGLGWLHIKDYKKQLKKTKGGHLDEDHDGGLRRPTYTGHEAILRDGHHPSQVGEKAHAARDSRRVVDLEPHVKGGGQFGGFSGPDGMGVALPVHESARLPGIGYHLATSRISKPSRILGQG